LQERITASTQETTNLKEVTRQLENDLVKLGEALIALTEEVRQQNSVFSDQTGKINALEESMAVLLGERAVQKTDTGQELSALRTQHAETRMQMDKARSQVDALEQDVGDQIKLLGYWGAGVALIFFIALTFVFILCMNRERPGRRDL
jgi:predicted RNase H-like nuclease (RuvC/YqgF family)